MAPVATVLAMDQSFGNLAQENIDREQAESLDNVNVFNEEDTHPSWMESGLKGCINAPVEQEVKISISHDGDYATAVCLAAKEEPGMANQPRKPIGQP